MSADIDIIAKIDELVDWQLTESPAAIAEHELISWTRCDGGYISVEGWPAYRALKQPGGWVVSHLRGGTWGVWQNVHRTLREAKAFAAADRYRVNAERAQRMRRATRRPLT